MNILMHIVQYLRRKSYITRTRVLKESFNGENDSLRILCKEAQLEYALLLQECINNKDIIEAKQLHSHIIQTEFNFPYNKLLTIYASYGSPVDACRVFDEMGKQNIVSWNVMIAAYARHGFSAEALVLFYKLQSIGVQPDQFTVASVLPACANLASLEQGFAMHGHNEEALSMVYKMQGAGVKPNQFTFASVLPACVDLATLEQGEEIHEEIIRNRFQSNCFVWNALVDMYAKCGSIENARYVFDKIFHQDVVSWNVMIAGYAMHGYGRQAIHLFEQMLLFGIIPEHATFVGVLSTCCHPGLVDEGWKYFYCMNKYYQITPTVEHYGYMVDLIGCAGLLDEAQDFIKKMPVIPDAAVSGSLLGVYRIHRNVEIGEYIVEKLIELNPKSITPYVLLLVIYATAGKLADIEKLRNGKDRRMKKNPGCIWLIVNKHVNAFLAGDKSHPQTEKIHAELERLAGKMKAVGYVPDTTYLLIT